MRIFNDKTKEEKEIEFTGLVEELLHKIKINPETVLVIRNNELINAKDKLKNEDEIKLLSIISGG